MLWLLQMPSRKKERERGTGGRGHKTYWFVQRPRPRAHIACCLKGETTTNLFPGRAKDAERMTETDGRRIREIRNQKITRPIKERKGGERPVCQVF